MNKVLENSLIIISTASQAFFLSQTPDVAQNSVLVITVKSSIEAEKILELLDKFAWKEIQIWKIPHATDKLVYFKLFQVRIKIAALQRRYQEITQVYFGSYANSVHLSIVAVFENSAKLNLLYDGLQLVSVLHFRNKASIENRRNFPLAYRILGFKEPELLKINYCSPLPMEVNGDDTIEVLQRKEPLKTTAVDEGVIYFIGQPLPDVGMVSSEYYISTLRKLKNNYSQKIIYFPHPREDKKLLGELSKYFEIKVPDTIFEEYYMQLEIVPFAVISFYSSVLVNLVFLKAASKIAAIEIPENEINEEQLRKLTAPIYEYFHDISNDNFQVLDSKNF